MNRNKKIFMWYKVNELNNEGLNKSQIKQELGIDRATIRKYLSMSEQEFHAWIQTPRHLPKKLQKYYFFVKNLLEHAPYLSAAQVEDRLKESFSDLPEVHSKTIYNFVQSIRKENNLPKHKEKTSRQYEKLPETDYGKEAQVDFGSYNMMSNGSGRVKVYFFVILLSRSRYKFVYFQRMPFTSKTASYAHELAFEYFKGIPRKIIYDQDRVFVTNENLGDFILTDKFMQFTSSFPFETVFCKKADPESKGKVENVVGYVKNNFLKGRCFYDIDSLNNDAISWLNRTGNGKVHNTTKRIPINEWKIEQQHLLPYSRIPEKPFLQLPTYPVRKDNTVLYRSNFYSLPLGTYQGKGTKIFLNEKDGKLFLYTLDNEFLTTHNVSLDTGRIIRNTDHKREKSKTLQKTYELVLHELGNSSQAQDYLYELEKDKPRHFHDNLRVIQKNIPHTSQIIINSALAFCLENKILNGNHFAEILYYYKNQQQKHIKPNIDIQINDISKLSINEMTPQTSNINKYESIM